MENLENLCATITQEADKILYDLGLLSALKKFGEVFITGSYYLNLMTWRDLDMYIDKSNMSEKDFFKLGYSISSVVQPYRMSYRNELISKTKGLPEGFYWGVYTNIIQPNTWKIDVWAVDSKQLADFRESSANLKSQIDPQKRAKILEIKHKVHNHPLYRKEFKSIDIYQAVLQESIADLEGFTSWLKDTRNVFF